MMDTMPRVLVVDDNQAIHEDFRKILTGAQSRNAALDAVESVLFDEPVPAAPTLRFDLEYASQGKEALELVVQAQAKGRPFSLAFVDIRMPPGWDGVETIEHLWKADPMLQVVICTAYSDYSWEKMSQRLGVNDNLVILKKPFDNIEVIQLAHSLTKKWLMTRQAQVRMEQLDAMVAERTVDLRRSEERFATAFQSSPLPMAIQAVSDDRFVDVNAAFLSLANCPREQIVGFRPRDLRWLLEYRDADTDAERLTGASATVSIHGSEPRPVLVSRARIQVDREPHVLLVLQDISERVRLESQLRQAQKMEAVGQLAAGVAHDFNNLLTIIEGHASLQLALGGTSEEVTQAFQEIEHASERAADLTRQLLTFSRQQIIRPRVLSLNDVLTGLHGMLARILGERVRLHCEFDPELPTIQADQTSMEQVAMNLMVNARDAMPAGGRITLTTCTVTRTAAELPENLLVRPGSFVRLSVQDTGVGMDAATRARIFEPFFTTKEVNKGTGMGLATVYGIVRQHEGWVDVETEVGKGATFHVYLPTCGQPADAPPPEPQVPQPGVRHSVFLVEDDTAVRSLVREMLEHFDFEVVEADSGDAALAMWPEIRDRIQLLLTDMVMPGDHNGMQLSLKLLADKPDLKVIYSSGYSPDLFSSDIELIDGQNYLPKPYLTSKLVAMVRRAFDEETEPAETLA